MKRISIKRNNQRSIIVLLGILTGLFVIGSSSFYYEIKARLYKVEAAVIDKTNSDQTEGRVVVSAYDAVSTVVSVNLSVPLLLSFGEVNTNQVEGFSTTSTEIKERLVPFFKTLFRKIISPNAP